jgi:hypothetical protein
MPGGLGDGSGSCYSTACRRAVVTLHSRDALSRRLDGDLELIVLFDVGYNANRLYGVFHWAWRSQGHDAEGYI